MSEEGYRVAIAALLPVTAAMLVTQVNPYHALVIRGIVGAVAALVYALFGAADVALTEALVGTMLSVTLCAIAVRSSMSLRLGVLATEAETAGGTAMPPVRAALRPRLQQYHLRLEVVPYDTPAALQQAIAAQAIHGVWRMAATAPAGMPPSALTLRLPHLYDLVAGALAPEVATVSLLPLVPAPAASPCPTPLEPQP